MESIPPHSPSNGNPNGETLSPGTNKHSTSTSQSHSTGATTSSNHSPTTSPPYWVQSHHRSFSNISVESVPDGAITLQDNTDGEDAKNKACWARRAHVDGHAVINGNRTGIGAFVSWNIRIETLQGGSMHISKRYSEFDDLRRKLLQTFPNSAAALPALPPKSLISKFRPKFLEHRRKELQYFLESILLNPEFSGSPVLKEFLFS